MAESSSHESARTMCVQNPVDQLREDARVERRPIHRWTKRDNDFFVGRKQNLAALRRRLRSCLEAEQVVHLHAAGAAIARAVDLSLKLVEEVTNMELSVNTSTVSAVEDYFPRDSQEEEWSKLKSISAIHITVGPRERD